MNSSTSNLHAKILARAKASAAGTVSVDTVTVSVPVLAPLSPFDGLADSSHGRHAGDVVRTTDGVVCTVRGFKRVCGGVIALCETETGDVVRLGRLDLLTVRVIVRHDAGKGTRSVHAPGYAGTKSGPHGGGGGVLVTVGGAQ